MKWPAKWAPTGNDWLTAYADSAYRRGASVAGSRAYQATIAYFMAREAGHGDLYSLSPVEVVELADAVRTAARGEE